MQKDNQRVWIVIALLLTALAAYKLLKDSQRLNLSGIPLISPSPAPLNPAAVEEKFFPPATTAEVPAPGAAAAPASTSQTAACQNRDPSGYLMLETKDLPDLHKADEFLTLPLKTRDQCVKVGQEIDLASRRDAEPTVPLLRGHGIVWQIGPGESVVIQLQERWLGRSGLVLKDCAADCDQILEALPDKPGPDVAILDLRFAHEIAEWKPERSFKPQIGRNESIADAMKKANVGRDKNIIVMTAGPFWTRHGVRLVMRELKSLGYRVSWYYGGAAAARGVPFFPVAPATVKTIRAVQVDELLKRGAQPYLIVYSRTPDEKVIPGSKIIVAPKLPVTPLGVFDLEFLEKMTDPANFEAGSLPMNPQAVYIIYGSDNLDWRPTFLLNHLTEKGFKNLYWLKGGSSEYEEAKALGLLAPPAPQTRK
ncbi:MAG: hypothetical protein KF865_02495 [Bdellovibrionaceae bacterium]|nr:hypothetical protein [Pseudobdellovibrionaceae bacterium]